ncbi:uncharacterized protein LOC135202593 isoform X2 [Macrobrachium nipponense]|uniref:uncharacterized protein LOC135202593 isoform X2 n=1 Tax=Macrobrachium nipponense TaxID=159736 RepID=UPI0030C8615B
MAEALFTSYEVIHKEPRNMASELLGSAKKAEASVRKSIRNYYTISQERVREGVDSAREFANQENCLGCLFTWRKNSRSAEEDEEPHETSKLLPTSASESYSACSRSESVEEKEPGKSKLKRTAKEVTEKLTGGLRTAGVWIVKGLQGYAEAVHPTGYRFTHDTVTYPYIS